MRICFSHLSTVLSLCMFGSLSAKVGKNKRQQRADINVQFPSEPRRYLHNLFRSGPPCQNLSLRAQSQGHQGQMPVLRLHTAPLQRKLTKWLVRSGKRSIGRMLEALVSNQFDLLWSRTGILMSPGHSSTLQSAEAAAAPPLLARGATKSYHTLI